MSTKTFEEIYFCLQTLEAYFNIPNKDKSTFLFLYKFENLFYQVEKLLLICCFDRHKLNVDEHNSQITCSFKKI